MLTLPTTVRVFAATEPVDGRKGIDGVSKRSYVAIRVIMFHVSVVRIGWDVGHIWKGPSLCTGRSTLCPSVSVGHHRGCECGEVTFVIPQEPAELLPIGRLRLWIDPPGRHGLEEIVVPEMELGGDVSRLQVEDERDRPGVSRRGAEVHYRLSPLQPFRVILTSLDRIVDAISWASEWVEVFEFGPNLGV